MKQVLLTFLILSVCHIVRGQVGIQTTNPQALLDIEALNPSAPSSTEGILIPRVDSFPSINPTANQDAMLVYLTTDLTGVNISGTAQNYASGFYYWDHGNTNWISVAGATGWKLDGNNDVVSGTHFIGTSNNQEVDFRVNNKVIGRLTELGQFELQADNRSLFLGFESGEAYGTGGADDTYIGYRSGLSSADGLENTAIGSSSLRDNVSGDQNTAVGYRALRRTTSNASTAVGSDALLFLTSGDNNTGVGMNVLPGLTTGDANVAMGVNAGTGLISGNDNVFLGNDASTSRSDMRRSVAMGYLATVGGNDAIAIGSDVTSSAFRSIAIGTRTQATVNDAIAIGPDAQAIQDEAVAIGNAAVATSDYAVSVGFQTSATGQSSTAIGRDASTTGQNSTAIGRDALATGQNSTALGYGAQATINNRIRLGNSAVTSIQGSVMFSTFSDKRFKEDVKEDIVGLNFIKQLQPVSYVFNKRNLGAFLGEPEEVDKHHVNPTREVGFLAQDVAAAAAKVDFAFSGVQVPENETKDAYTIQYAAFVVPLVKAVQEQQDIIETQKEKIEDLETRLARLEALLSKK